MNKTTITTLLLSLVTLGCSGECPETKAVVQPLCNCDCNKDKAETPVKADTPTKDEMPVKAETITKSFNCKDSAGRDYKLTLSNIEDKNKPVTAINFNFTSSSKEKGNASDYWLEITKDGADVKKLSATTKVDGEKITSGDFFLDSEVEYYLTVKRFELDDDSWKQITIAHSADIYGVHPIHDSKSTCSLVPQK